MTATISDSLGAYLKRHREALLGTEQHVAQEDIAEALGFAQSYISKLERGGLDQTVLKWKAEKQWQLLKAYRLSDDAALSVSKSFGLDLPPSVRPADMQADASISLGRMVKVYPAGTGPTWDLEEILETIYLPESVFATTRLLGLKAMSTSMEPYLPQGSTAVIALDDGLVAEGDFCGIRLADEGVVIKRFVKELENGGLLLESLNPDPGEERFFVAPIGSRIMGKVVRRVLEG